MGSAWDHVGECTVCGKSAFSADKSGRGLCEKHDPVKIAWKKKAAKMKEQRKIVEDAMRSGNKPVFRVKAKSIRRI